MQGSNYAPSTPPMSTISSTNNTDELSSKLQYIALYCMPMTRIDIDNQYVALYQNNTGMIYRTMKLNNKKWFV